MICDINLLNVTQHNEFDILFISCEKMFVLNFVGSSIN